MTTKAYQGVQDTAFVGAATGMNPSATQAVIGKDPDVQGALPFQPLGGGAPVTPGFIAVP